MFLCVFIPRYALSISKMWQLKCPSISSSLLAAVLGTEFSTGHRVQLLHVEKSSCVALVCTCLYYTYMCVYFVKGWYISVHPHVNIKIILNAYVVISLSVCTHTHTYILYIYTHTCVCMYVIYLRYLRVYYSCIGEDSYISNLYVYWWQCLFNFNRPQNHVTDSLAWVCLCL